MLIELTEQLQQLLENQGGKPLRLVNPRTSEVFVLVPAAVYERLEAALQEGFHPREAYPLVDRIMAEDDENDPYLESYQHFGRGNRP